MKWVIRNPDRPQKTVEDVARMTGEELDRFFEDYALFQQDSPKPYCIQFGGTTLRNSDTYGLKKHLIRTWKILRAKEGQLR